MPKATSNEVVTQGNKRFYVQWGGALPGNPLRYGGVDGQYMMVGGVTKSFGSTDAIRVPDPHRIGEYRRVARSRTPEDDPTATITFLEQHGSIPRAFLNRDCGLNVYEVTGLCRDLSDFTGGWEDYVMVYAGGEATDLDGGDRGAWDGDDQVEDALDVTFSDIYPVGSMSFAEYASNEISREVIDVVYGPANSCGNCGPADDGTRRIYAVTKSSGTGSPGLPGELVYTIDSGTTWVENVITGLGATEDPKAVKIVGDKLVILTGIAYYWATLNQNTGAPGVWTKVTSGFNVNASANDFVALSPREIFFAANSGYIYKSSDITAGVTTVSAGAQTSQNLLRIHGDPLSGTLLAVGANSTTLRGTNRGQAWAATSATIPTTVASAQAVAVLDNLRAWVGTSSGRVFYTDTAGESWSEKVVGDNLIIRDIVWATDEVGYIAYDGTGPTAYLLTTMNGGADWAANGSGRRLQGMPTMDRINRVGVPVAESGIASNAVALAALHGNGTDGLLALAAAPIK